jgi:two-component system phosphate regulon sensor histidine kinase PhoR
VVGLALSLVAALVALRRRAAEMDALVAVASTEPAAPGDPPPSPARLNLTAPLAVPGPVAELLPVGVLHLGANRRVDRANARAHALLEVAPGRLVGRTVMEAFLDARLDALVEGLGSGHHHDDGGSAGRASRGPSCFACNTGRTTGPGSSEDVTELRRLQQIRAEFIDNLSHELRTPLSTVSLLAETLARDAETADVPSRMRERIAKVEVETGHLVQMVNELLDLARIEGGTQLQLTDDVDLGRLASSSVERLRMFAERQGVQLEVTVDPATPRVHGDEDRLGQVFVNLVHNAVKFSPDGGDVTIDVHPGDGEAVAAVTDHGIGVPKTDQARIFERFYKVDRARLRGGGTGLGLSIARHVVERHGGRIWVESEEGRGSTFSFAIPVAAAPADPGRPGLPNS